jgi:hypothetical protein
MGMNSSSIVCHFKFSLQALLTGLGLLICGPASAQNLLNNPNFDAPIATVPSVTTNWVVTYVYGGPSDFSLRDRTTYSAKGFQPAAGAFGAQFRPMTDGEMHAYFKQTVSGLVPGNNYVVSGYMFNTWPQGDGAIDIYIGTVGGLNGGNEVRTSNCTNYFAYGDTPYSVTNTAKANGTLEVRLHFNKVSNTVVKAPISTACFDNISLTHQ